MNMKPDTIIPETYICRKKKGLPGNLPDESAWETAIPLWPLFRRPQNADEKKKARPAAREQTVCRMLWDENFLYVSVQLMCEEYFALPDAPTWESDVIELFLQPDGKNPYYEFHANVDGRLWAASFSGAMGDGRTLMDIGWDLCEHTREPGCWKVTLRLPWKVIPGKIPSPGDEWRFNLARQNFGTNFTFEAIQRGNAVRGREPSCSAAWVDGVMAFHDCDHFDIIRFE